MDNPLPFNGEFSKKPRSRIQGLGLIYNHPLWAVCTTETWQQNHHFPPSIHLRHNCQCSDTDRSHESSCGSRKWGSGMTVMEPRSNQSRTNANLILFQKMQYNAIRSQLWAHLAASFSPYGTLCHTVGIAGQSWLGDSCGKASSKASSLSRGQCQQVCFAKPISATES